MRIGFFVPRCTSENSHGRYVIELARRLSGIHDVVIYSAAFDASIKAVAECHSLPIPSRPSILRILSLWFLSVVVSRGRFDIVHIQGADAPIGDVITAHCCNFAMRLAASMPSRVRRFNYAIGVTIERYCFTKPRVKRLIAPSHQLKAEVERYYGVSSGKTIVIPHGVDSRTFHPRNRVQHASKVRAELGISPTDFVVVFVGGDYRLKGLPILKEAIQATASTMTILAVGVTKDALRDLGGKTFNGSIICLGPVPDVARYYAAGDCFVLPTRYDTFSLSTLEAMSSGLPVVVSRRAGISEYLTHRENALLLDDHEDASSLARMLRELAADARLRAQLGDAARVFAEAYTWERAASQTVAIYDEARGMKVP